jgi:hypothetical protein
MSHIRYIEFTLAGGTTGNDEHPARGKESLFMMSLERSHTHGGRTSRVVVTRGARGWDLREEVDDQIVKQATYTDWHRVERAMMVFDLREGQTAYSAKR